MPRFFSTSAAQLLKWAGYPLNSLKPEWKAAAVKFTGPGGGAEKRLGAVKKATIKVKGDDPVHKSHYNPQDKADVLSIRIEGEDGTKTCHVYEDGTGTTKKGEEPR